MLTKGLILGLLAPLLIKPRDLTPVNDRDPPELPPLPPVAIASVTETEAAETAVSGLPWPELPRMRSTDEAVAELLAELTEFHGAGAALRFAHVARYYRQFAGRRAWPPIADKTLSRLLLGLGCAREQRDHRAIDGTRPTYLVLVPALAIDEDEIFEAVPLRLAA